MTEKEALEDVLNTDRWYTGFCSSGYASTLRNRYNTTTLSQPTIDAIIRHGGYKIVQERKYEKTT